MLSKVIKSVFGSRNDRIIKLLKQRVLLINQFETSMQALSDDELKHKTEELKQRFDISFNHLYTITNMPIKRFGSTLISKGLFTEYMQLLKTSYSKDNLAGVMCRTTLSVDWLGYAYDCDFNQMLGLPATLKTGGSTVTGKTHIKDLLQSDLTGSDIAIMDHCYGCTAGQGSSCGGALI